MAFVSQAVMSDTLFAVPGVNHLPAALQCRQRGDRLPLHRMLQGICSAFASQALASNALCPPNA